LNAVDRRRKAIGEVYQRWALFQNSTELGHVLVERVKTKILRS